MMKLARKQTVDPSLRLASIWNPCKSTGICLIIRMRRSVIYLLNAPNCAPYRGKVPPFAAPIRPLCCCCCCGRARLCPASWTRPRPNCWDMVLILCSFRFAKRASKVFGFCLLFMACHFPAKLPSPDIV